MTTITCADDVRNDLRNIGFAGLGALSTVYNTATTDVVTVAGSDGYAIVFQGTGYGHLDRNGMEISGTTHSLASWGLDEQIVQLSDFSVSAKQLSHLVENENNVGFQRLLLSGDDTINSGAKGGEFAGFDGNDTINGSHVGDTLEGDKGADVLFGGGGGDMLTGGIGRDSLTGGAGADSFVFGAVADSRGAGVDTINDLQRMDTIDLSAIDANTTNGSGDDAFVTAAAFTGVAGQLVIRYQASHDRTIISGDIDGDKHADIVIYAPGDHTSYIQFVL